MKRKDLIRYLLSKGCVREREGRKHTLFYNPETKSSGTVPRHREINNFTVHGICKELGIPVVRIR
ncbi:type II toxin-antitoxin system HicA family toxin [Desulfonema magnum]|uniref:type II toxin-antitoxin system HicA family toxin n=1 Tax=Desulfonema magnum TaxID=45655 RepID=UPI001A9BB639